MSRKIFLMRHADPENPNDLMYGNLPGFPLSELGKRQANEAGEFMKQFSLDLIVSSDLERAIQTAESVKKDNPGNPDLIIDERLRDLKIDAWQGKNTLEDWLNNRMDYWKKQSVGEDGVELPSQTQSRIVTAFSEYVKEYPDQNVIFVFHGDPLTFLIEFLLKKELSPRPNFSFGKIEKANILEVSLGPDVSIQKIFEPTVK